MFNPTDNEALELKFRANSFENALPIFGMVTSGGSLIYDISCVFYYAIGGAARACISDWTHSTRCFDCCGYSLQACAYSIMDICSLGFLGIYRTEYSKDGKIDLLVYRILQKENGKQVTDPIKCQIEYEDARKRIAEARGVTYSSEQVPMATTFELMQKYDFNSEAFNKKAAKYIKQFVPTYDLQNDYGYVEKKVVDEGTQIFVRADLHGDLVSLKANLEMLKKEELLDENFKCKEKVHLVFLGDYVDRGQYSMQVLELLMTLRMENPEQVTLIRGNHEDVNWNAHYSSEPIFDGYITNKKELLTGIYQTMTLGLYLGQKSDTQMTEYALFTHAVFEPEFQAGAFLDGEALTAHVPKIEDGRDIPEYTHFNTADIGDTTKRVNGTAMPENTIRAYLKKNYTTKSKIKRIYKGHTHKHDYHFYDGKNGKKLLAITLSVGADSVFKAPLYDGKDTTYIFNTKAKVKEWSTRAARRLRGSAITTVEPIVF